MKNKFTTLEFIVTIILAIAAFALPFLLMAGGIAFLSILFSLLFTWFNTLFLGLNLAYWTQIFPIAIAYIFAIRFVANSNKFMNKLVLTFHGTLIASCILFQVFKWTEIYTEYPVFKNQIIQLQNK